MEKWISYSYARNVHHWLVEHPLVNEFEWKEGVTWGASTQFLLTAVFTYLSLTAFLHFFITTKSTVGTPSTSSSSSSSSSSSGGNHLLLRFVSIIHNLILLILSFIMAVGCILSTSSQMIDYRWIFCFPQNKTPPNGPVFFWAYIFYLSKLLEFIDTLLIILNTTSSRRLTFLHVYHHAVVVVMCYVWLHTSQSLLPVALVTNCLVHTLMYAYYMLCTLGIRPRWKRLVTDCQIVQFAFSFGVSGVMLWFHLTGNGCSGYKGWVFNAVFNASLLVLFTHFHSKNYAKKKKGGNKEEIKKKT